MRCFLFFLIAACLFLQSMPANASGWERISKRSFGDTYEGVRIVNDQGTALELMCLGSEGLDYLLQIFIYDVHKSFSGTVRKLNNLDNESTLKGSVLIVADGAKEVTRRNGFKFFATIFNRKHEVVGDPDESYDNFVRIVDVAEEKFSIRLRGGGGSYEDADFFPVGTKAASIYSISNCEPPIRFGR